jgi:hypothetical protein
MDCLREMVIKDSLRDVPKQGGISTECGSYLSGKLPDCVLADKFPLRRVVPTLAGCQPGGADLP